MGMTLEALDIAIEGDFDVAAFQTEQPNDRTAVQNIEVTLAAESPTDDETLQEWGERVEARVPSPTTSNTTPASHSPSNEANQTLSPTVRRAVSRKTPTLPVGTGFCASVCL